ncbi:alpha-amylase family glycosyl hydrolase [Marilutibacter spongiae]|uniref:Alpha-amylase n=1 Tax=Marilutibacter spongiae TaxID=2025720 RepID=A0A7W3TNS5_9GAMM|nr:alpha-amylase family glycosyl hydrolase [Lysobacter spongiae]MBB1061720.1 cyclomaltodextrin glucanotransferase [Lysobacter spongiae]
MSRASRAMLGATVAAVLAACAHAPDPAPSPLPVPSLRPDYYGTLEPFASDAVYFVMTDRFVNGDPANDQRGQGGGDPALRTFDRPVPGDANGANIGYLGGDFRGLLDNADYIADMGFGAVWLTPIVDNPDEAFTGGDPIGSEAFFKDRGKTGYHGYWGVDFFRLDEHLPSAGLDFAGLTAGLRQHGLKTVLDIVGNHGSPSFTMPVDQPKFGEIYDDGRLVADHQNLAPADLDPAGNPLHRFFHSEPDLAQLSNNDDSNPDVLDYYCRAYSKWIGEGAAAFRIDTIRHMPPAFWQRFSDCIRDTHPGFFMFGEAFDHDADKIAPFTWPGGGEVSVLDFPLKERIDAVFGRQRQGYETIAERLYLTDGPYANPYELMTFYDNHDMPRMDASDEGFIDAHNFLFTARGIPVIYQGSEIGFMRGAAEHAGNRNYLGQARIDAAPGNPIHDALRRIARVREATPALQRGLQLDVAMQGERAVFYRVLQEGRFAQLALVMLNKGDAPVDVEVSRWLQPGAWRAALSGRTQDVGAGGVLRDTVPAHGVEVWVLDAPVRRDDLREALDQAMAHRLGGPAN